jgi:hypothetical protein
MGYQFLAEQITTGQNGETEEILVDPVILYCLVRTDVPDFLWGKACAQTHHNGTQMTEELRAKNHPDLNELYTEWQEDRTFGTVLTLAVNAAEMRQAVNLAQLLGFHAGVTHDPTYPIFIRDGDQTKIATLPVDTCGYVFGRKSELAPVLGQFDLLSERHIVR